MPRYREKLPPPAEVLVEFYDPAKGHIAVAKETGYADGRAGTLLSGVDKTPVGVFVGDAIINHGGHVYSRLPRGDLSAFYEPFPLPKIPSLQDTSEKV